VTFTAEASRTTGTPVMLGKTVQPTLFEVNHDSLLNPLDLHIPEPCSRLQNVGSDDFGREQIQKQ
jgi:hypothetical protein